MIDAYAHVGLPRFQTIGQYRTLMETVGIRRAVLSSFDSSPDLAAIHDAIRTWPDSFRGLCVPLGHDRAEMETAVRAQLAAGFSGLRLSHQDVMERVWLLEVLADMGKIAVFCGQAAAPDCARALVGHLERHPSATVVGGHFGGGGSPAALADGAVAALFSHPRFLVVFSRHGGHPAAAIRAWAEAVLGRTGWSRVMWGSEAPVLFLRNETMAEAVAWVDRLAPSLDERALFFEGTARALYFTTPAVVAPLVLPFDPWERAVRQPSVMWLHGLPVDQALAGRLIQAWLASGAQGNLGNYMESVLDGVLRSSQ